MGALQVNSEVLPKQERVEQFYLMLSPPLYMLYIYDRIFPRYFFFCKTSKFLSNNKTGKPTNILLSTLFTECRMVCGPDVSPKIVFLIEEWIQLLNCLDHRCKMKKDVTHLHQGSNLLFKQQMKEWYVVFQVCDGICGEYNVAKGQCWQGGGHSMKKSRDAHIKMIRLGCFLCYFDHPLLNTTACTVMP